jgi:hypothetical protein
MAAVPPLFTVYDDMVICGIDNAILFQGCTQAERISFEIFSDDFSTTMDVSTEELNEEFQALLGMTAAQGMLRQPQQYMKFLEIYINMPPHNGEAFVMDNAKVLVLLKKYSLRNSSWGIPKMRQPCSRSTLKAMEGKHSLPYAPTMKAKDYWPSTSWKQNTPLRKCTMFPKNPK